jgi:acetyl esterase/lipase
VVVVGHSSGGHLALWLAGRRNLLAGSPLRGSDPLPLADVVSLAGVNDLEGALSLGDRRDVLDLIGAETAPSSTRFATTSPRRLLPLRAPQVLVIGSKEETWRIEMTRAYAAAASEAGDKVELLILGGANHADVVDSHGPAPAMIARILRSLTAAAARAAVEQDAPGT